MTSIILMILAATLVYAGVLMIERDLTTALGSVVLGLLLSVNPVLRIVGLFKPAARPGKRPKPKGPFRPYVVRPGSQRDQERDEPPTIH
ncbi:MAG: hypothetical protein LLG06_12620 [Desulfobacteraceae bacterium]|nr:hypothetical protein [Desulfobacteraceae bacterium]